MLLKSHRRQLNIFYMVVLALYPMLRIFQGLSVMDTTYSAANALFHDEMNGTWMVATYVANAIGDIFTELPWGNTVLGFNFYTSLVISLTAVSAFLFLKRDIQAGVLFIGELLALSLCWCPSSLLYNYITYLLFTVGALVLYRGACGGRDDCFVAAGIILGFNVGTRFPNVTEAALIVVVWYVAIIEKKKFARALKETFMCLGGYLLGFVIIYATIVIRYTTHAYGDMIQTLFAMTDKAEDYKPTSMVTAIFSDYLYAWKWIAMFAIAVLICALVYKVSEKSRSKNTRYVLTLGFSLLAIAFVVRVCYGQGMFSFRYYEYGSMYYWAVLLLAIVTVACLIYIFHLAPLAGENLNLHRKKILSVIVLIITYITCLGSNNAMYPIVNNLFIVGPFICWVVYDLVVENVKGFRPKEKNEMSIIPLKYGATIVALVVITATFIQGIGFHTCFAIQDGDDGMPRNAKIVGYAVTDHIYTTEQNATNLQGLMDFYYGEYCGQENSDNQVADRSATDATAANKKLILYGNCPGLGFLLDSQTAISTFWPDLDSYTYQEWEADIKDVSERITAGIEAPVIITSIQVAAWEGGDPDAINFWGVDTEKYNKDQKLADLIELMYKYNYKQVYCNDGYSVYEIVE